MGELNFKTMRVAFQGEPGAFSEAAAVRLLGESIHTVPRPTFDATFRAIAEGAADALLLPLENTLAGSVVRVYDLLLEAHSRFAAKPFSPSSITSSPAPARPSICFAPSLPILWLLLSASASLNHSPISSASPPKTLPAASAK